MHLVQNLRGYEALVDVAEKKLLAWNEVPGRQYMTSRSEADAAEEPVLKDARVRAAFAKRGVTDLTHVGCGPANHGYFDLAEERGHRVVHVTCDDGHGRVSGYEAGIYGLVIVVDLTNKKILRVLDTPSVGTGGEGLPKWTAANRAVKNTDVVAWLTLGFHHVPRPEDWPIMPVAWHSFEIQPVGFFSRNPSIDLPRVP